MSVTLVVIVWAFLAGVVATLLFQHCYAGRKEKEADTGRWEDAKDHEEKKRDSRTVGTQSQCTYRLDLMTPRFQPLPDRSTGVWEHGEYDDLLNAKLSWTAGYKPNE